MKWHKVVRSALLDPAEPGDTLFAPALLAAGGGFQPAESGDTKMRAITRHNFIARIHESGYNTPCSSGRGAARLARLHGVQEVGGSNPLAPTDPQTAEPLRSAVSLFRDAANPLAPTDPHTAEPLRSAVSLFRDAANPLALLETTTKKRAFAPVPAVLRFPLSPLRCGTQRLSNHPRIPKKDAVAQILADFSASSADFPRHCRHLLWTPPRLPPCQSARLRVSLYWEW